MPSIDELPNTRELQQCLNTLKHINAHHECIGAPNTYWRSKQGRREKREFSQLRGAQRAIANMVKAKQGHPGGGASTADSKHRTKTLQKEVCRIHNSAVAAARDFGSCADEARINALKHKAGTKRRAHWLTICRVWAIAEARMRSTVENCRVKPDYKRTREPYPDF